MKTRCNIYDEPTDRTFTKNNVTTPTNYISNLLINVTYYIYTAAKVYVMWIILHFGASHLYIYICVPQTFWGFIISPFMSVTPQCQSLRWIIYTGANIINNMWIVLGTWCCTLLLSGTNYDPE